MRGILFLFLSQLAWANDQEQLETPRFETHSVDRKETLSEILSNRNLFPIWGDQGSVNQSLMLNPELKDSKGNLIFPKQEIKLPILKPIQPELPPEPKDPAQTAQVGSIQPSPPDEMRPATNYLGLTTSFSRYDREINNQVFKLTSNLQWGLFFRHEKEHSKLDIEIFQIDLSSSDAYQVANQELEILISYEQAALTPIPWLTFKFEVDRIILLNRTGQNVSLGQLWGLGLGPAFNRDLSLNLEGYLQILIGNNSTKGIAEFQDCRIQLGLQTKPMAQIFKQKLLVFSDFSLRYLKVDDESQADQRLRLGLLYQF